MFSSAAITEIENPESQNTHNLKSEGVTGGTIVMPVLAPMTVGADGFTRPLKLGGLPIYLYH